MFGRRLRGVLPTYEPKINVDSFAKGEIVMVQNAKTKRWDVKAEIVLKMNKGRSYEVVINGYLSRRNVRFIRRIHNQSKESKPQDIEPKPIIKSERRRSPRFKKNN